MSEFAKILREIIRHYQHSPNSKRFKKIKNDMLIHLLDRCLRVASHLIPPDASKSAIKRAEKHGIDLFKMREKDRNKVEKQIKLKDKDDREKFILEHFIPVNQIIKSIIDEKNVHFNTCESALAKLKVIWVLKSEDDLLNKNGHRTNRPNPEDAYQKAWIIILQNRYGHNWLD